MAKDTKKAQEKTTATSEFTSCMEMMAKMMSQGESGCSCEEISQCTCQEGVPADFLGMMSQMSESCCSDQGEAKSASQ